jgi:hypothetical protein
MDNREIFNTHKIKGLNVKIYYPNSDEYQFIINELLLPNKKLSIKGMYFDLGEYQISKFLIPLITNLDIDGKEKEKELKRSIIKGDKQVGNVVEDLKNILQIATGIFTDNVNSGME